MSRPTLQPLDIETILANGQVYIGRLALAKEFAVEFIRANSYADKPTDYRLIAIASDSVRLADLLMRTNLMMRLPTDPTPATPEHKT